MSYTGNAEIPIGAIDPTRFADMINARAKITVEVGGQLITVHGRLMATRTEPSFSINSVMLGKMDNAFLSRLILATFDPITVEEAR